MVNYELFLKFLFIGYGVKGILLMLMGLAGVEKSKFHDKTDIVAGAMILIIFVLMWFL